MTKELYQTIYENEKWYGDAGENRCPGVRLIPNYVRYLVEPVIDLGCGRGHTVVALRAMNYDCIGIDQVEINDDMIVGDITKPIEFEAKTTICMDVIEHIPDEQLIGLFENMRKAERQVFSIHNGESWYKGEDLHVNKKPFADWMAFIVENGLGIVDTKVIHSNQWLFFTETITKEQE